jgi:hypothetical protein
VREVEKLTDFGREDSLVVKQALNPGHQSIDVGWCREGGGFLVGRAVFEKELEPDTNG